MQTCILQPCLLSQSDFEIPIRNKYFHQKCLLSSEKLEEHVLYGVSPAARLSLNCQRILLALFLVRLSQGDKVLGKLCAERHHSC